MTSTPTTTNIPGAKDEEVELTCIVSAKPLTSSGLSWRRNLDGIELSSQNDGKVNSITKEINIITMKVTVTEVNELFYCVAMNLLGNDSQVYKIRERGR